MLLNRKWMRGLHITSRLLLREGPNEFSDRWPRRHLYRLNARYVNVYLFVCVSVLMRRRTYRLCVEIQRFVRVLMAYIRGNLTFTCVYASYISLVFMWKSNVYITSIIHEFFTVSS